MNNSLEVFFSWQTLLLCLFTYGLTFGVRSITESVFPSVERFHLWPKLILPLLPLLFGMVLAFVPGIPWPEMLGGSATAHAVYGFVCGMFSSHVYAKVKDYAKPSGEL